MDMAERLEKLDWSNKKLKSIPQLQSSLTVVNLTGNLLSAIPDLASLYNLEVLYLSQNRIGSLEHINRIPKNLKELAIEANNICDISQLILLGHLEGLVNINISPLPALPDHSDHAPFNYRHLMLCILPGLQVIDAKEVDNAEALCGEHLYMAGKLTGRKKEFVPGGGDKAHDYVWDYLARKNQEFLGDETNKTPLKSNMMKFLHEKERYQKLDPKHTMSPRQGYVISPAVSFATEDDFSCHSPFADWNRIRGKENTDPETTDASPISTQRSSMTRNLRIVETAHGVPLRRRSGRHSIVTPEIPESETEKEEQPQSSDIASGCSTVESTDGKEETILPKPKPRTRVTPDKQTPPRQFTPDTMKSSEREESAEEDQMSADCVTPRIPFRIVTTTPLSRRRASTPARKFGVADITSITYSGLEFEERMHEMEQKMADLSEFCENLAKTNEHLSCLLIEQESASSKQLQKLQERIDSLLAPPKPTALSIQRKNGPSVEVRWELMHVQGYNVYIDGVKAGTISAPTRLARITDLEANREHTIQLKAISYAGVEGPVSEPLRVPAVHDSDL